MQDCLTTRLYALGAIECTPVIFQHRDASLRDLQTCTKLSHSHFLLFVVSRNSPTAQHQRLQQRVSPTAAPTASPLQHLHLYMCMHVCVLPHLPLKEPLPRCSIGSSIIMAADSRSLSGCWVHQPDAKSLSAARRAGHFGGQNVLHAYASEESAFLHPITTCMRE